VTPIVILTILVLFPIATFVTLLCNRKKLEDKKFKKRYENLYKNLSTASAKQYMFNVLYMLRRFFFVFSIVFLPRLSFVQVSA
jgi:hypothetical protein